MKDKHNFEGTMESLLGFKFYAPLASCIERGRGRRALGLVTIIGKDLAFEYAVDIADDRAIFTTLEDAVRFYCEGVLA